MVNGYVNEFAIRARLREEVNIAGSQKRWADLNGISKQYVGDVFHGRREPGEKILNALGYEKVVLYQRTDRRAPSNPL